MVCQNPAREYEIKPAAATAATAPPMKLAITRRGKRRRSRPAPKRATASTTTIAPAVTDPPTRPPAARARIAQPNLIDPPTEAGNLTSGQFWHAPLKRSSDLTSANQAARAI